MLLPHGVQLFVGKVSCLLLGERLDAALESLPAGQRHALELRVVDELPYERVAEALDCSETAARLRVMRALGKLARLLGASA